MDCPDTDWFDSVPVTPTASLLVDDRTVLLAGPTSRGVETAVYAADIHTRSYTRLALLGGTNHLTAIAIARARDGAVYVLTDIRGNDRAPHLHLLHLTLPAR